MRSPFAPRARPVAGPLTLRSAGRTHRGCVREHNEDAFLEAGRIGLWAVADGMGGLEAGDVASKTVIDALDTIASASSPFALGGDVAQALQGANDRLNALADERGADAIGATVVALLVHEGHYACVWAGDSRGYLYRHGALTPLTRDHSLVQELVDSGAMTAAEARRSNRRNIITRAVGIDEVLELDMRQDPLEAGDLFLLCSDGLTGVIEDDEIAAALAEASDLGACADGLIEQSLRRGAPDNVTVVLVRAEAS